MIVPGSNLLGIALGVIGAQTITLYRATGRTQNPRGDWVPTYAAGIPVEGSWQPVDAAKYALLGLDLKRQYFNFYTRELVLSADREQSPDVATRDGRRYETVGTTPWNNVDGWQAALFVDVGVAP